MQGNDNKWYNLVVTEQSKHLFKLQCKGGYFSFRCPARVADTERNTQFFFARKWTAERLLLTASSPLLFVLRDGKPPMSHFPQWTPWSMKTSGRGSTEICAKASGLFLKNIYCCSMKHQLHNPSPQRLKLAQLFTVLYFIFTQEKKKLTLFSFNLPVDDSLLKIICYLIFHTVVSVVTP